MSLYNLSALQNSETITDIVVAANNATGQVLMGLFLVAIFIVFVLRLKKYDFEDTILASSFIFFILSVFLRQAQLVNFIVVLVFLVILAFSMMYKVMVRT